MDVPPTCTCHLSYVVFVAPRCCASVGMIYPTAFIFLSNTVHACGQAVYSYQLSAMGSPSPKLAGLSMNSAPSVSWYSISSLGADRSSQQHDMAKKRSPFKTKKQHVLVHVNLWPHVKKPPPSQSSKSCQGPIGLLGKCQ